MKSVLFILPVGTQPRFAKRISSFISKNIEVAVATFERDYFNLNKLPEGIKITSLGKIRSGNYLLRVPQLIKSIPKLIRLSRRADTVYIFSPDILIVARPFFCKKKIIYEIGDIRKLGGNGISSTIFHYLYKKMLISCSSIIVTSLAFREYIIETYGLDNNRVGVIENKLQNDMFFNNKDKYEYSEIHSHFTVGIIGYLRYPNIINFLQAYKMHSNNKFKIVIYGDGHLREDILKYVDNDSISTLGNLSILMISNQFMRNLICHLQCMIQQI